MTMKRTVTRTEGSHLVAALRRRVGGTRLAGMLGVSEAQLRAVAAGQRRPGDQLRERLVKHEVPLDAWSRPPSATSRPALPAAPSAQSPRGRERAAGGGEPPDRARPGGTTLEELDAQVLRLRRQAEAADLDTMVSIKDRAAIGAALTSVLRLRSKHLGEDELTEARIARSAPFRRAMSAIVGALKPYPDALRAVRAAFAEIEAQS